MADFSREFTEATGINLQFTSLNSDDLQQKTILDTATKTNAYDVYLNAYQWKQEIVPTSPTSLTWTSRSKAARHSTSKISQKPPSRSTAASATS